MTHGTYRPELDGLRGISILLVVAFHAGVPQFSGGYVGVDVFFVLSGFLITSLLFREVESSGRLDLAKFFAKRIRRLLPLAAVVIVTTACVGLLLQPPLQRPDLLSDAVASLLYVSNWRFSSLTTDYFGAEVSSSLFLHFWSLSIEEQFYAVWPVSVAISAWYSRRKGYSYKQVILSLALAVTLISFASSVWITRSAGSVAYFLSHTRAWELGVGALLALSLPMIRSTPRIWRELFALVGLTVIVLSALVYDETTRFPGAAAALPVFGASLLIAASFLGSTDTVRSLSFLSAKPLTYIGRISYAWYLWHWPAIGAALLAQQQGLIDASATTSIVAAVAISFALSAASHAWIENPIRYARGLQTPHKRSFWLATSLTAAPLLLYVVALTNLNMGAEPVDLAFGQQREHDQHEGRAFRPGGMATEVPPPMSPQQASQDRVTLATECHSNLAGQASPIGLSLVESCLVGDPSGQRLLLVTGDSHARHWLPGLDVWGQEHGWQILALTKSSCPPFDVRVWNARLGLEYTECDLWREERDRTIATLKPDVILVARSYNYHGAILDAGGKVPTDDFARQGVWADGAARTFNRLLESARGVVVFLDTPWAAVPVPDCLSTASSSDCALALDETSAGLGHDLFSAEMDVAPAGVVHVDPTSLICPRNPCPMVTDSGIIKYSDRHHLTQTYSAIVGGELNRLLGPAIAAALD